MPAASLQRYNPPPVGALGKLVFVELAKAAFERLSPSRPVISDAVGILPASDDKRDARSVDGDDRRLVDEQYSLGVWQCDPPVKTRSGGLTHANLPLVKLLKCAWKNAPRGRA